MDNAQECYRHPGKATGLSCSECNQAICSDCARQTPVSIKCVKCLDARIPSALRLTIWDIVAFALVGLGVGGAIGLAASYVVNWIFLSADIPSFLWRFALGLAFGLSALAARFALTRLFKRKSFAQNRAVAFTAIASVAVSVGAFIVAILYIHGGTGATVLNILLNFNVFIGLALGFLLLSGGLRRKR